tara:strand:+ start:189523 stop:190542 length:1020 start_codon:yes stop_codon:yes gene_type:complete
MKQTCLSILILSSFFTVASAATKLNGLKDKLNSHSSKIVKLGAQIKSLEKSLTKKNSEYLERLNRLKKFQAKVDELMVDLKARQEEISEERQKLKMAAQTYILEKNDEEDDDSLISRVLLEDQIEHKLAILNDMQKENDSLVEVISQYSAKLNQVKEEEDMLYNLILSLEEQKKETSKEYITNLELKNQLEEKLEAQLAQKKAIAKNKKVEGANIDLDFNIILPIKKFSDYKGSKEGVTFKYDSTEPLIACANGQVEYAGELASYGKVIILKHGKDIRSVILGEIKSKVQKGQQVRQGQIIGYTIASPGTKKSLYYEIRKKNKVQNTLAWLKSKNSNLL